jgi:hypothetical protein
VELNVCLDTSFDTNQDKKGIREKAGEVNGMKVYIKNETSR